MMTSIQIEPLAIVGDVHGDAARLRALLADSALIGRRVIFVGDLVNRGPCSREVLDMVCVFVQHHPQTIILKGNHDLALLQYLSHGDTASLVKLLSMGGAPTILSYVGQAFGDVHRQFTAAFPPSHSRVLSSALGYWETEHVFVSHSALSPANPGSRTILDMTESHPLIFDAPLKFNKMVVCGHYVQSSEKPYVSQNLICVDTGCGTSGGPLTALLLPEVEFIQH